MTYRPRNKKPDSGPKLARDANNLLDKEEAKRVNQELLAKFLTESRHLEKEGSFHVSRTGRRDIVVHLAVTILPRVDGNTVVGENSREMGQWCFELPARALPISNGKCIKAFAELCHIGKQVLMTMGVVKP